MVLPAWMFPGGGCRRRSSWAAPASRPAPGSETGAASSPSPPSSRYPSCAVSQKEKELEASTRLNTNRSAGGFRVLWTDAGAAEKLRACPFEIVRRANATCAGLSGAL
jgi:hypothetical protein